MIILASSSPRRKLLMKKITSRFVCVKPNIDERIYKFNTSSYALELSRLKAYEVYSRYPHATIIACDTIVVLNHTIINKPKDNNDAKRILKKLSNKTHLVISGYTIINQRQEINRSVVTSVTFNKLTDKLINEYVSKGFTKGKAGAYGIQDGYPLVKSIDGSYDNVVGLPTEDIIKHFSLN
ncbi:MAG: Maf family protein [Bacilli bacterium]|nr:Maf family protein [Bacilli bacterium]